MISAIEKLAAIAPTMGSDAPAWVALTDVLREIQGEAALDRLTVMSTEQAKQAANQDSISAFRRWARKWRVKPVGHDRWAGRDLRAGLEREADNVLHRRKRRKETSA